MNNAPRVSVIVAAYHSAEHLPGCLDALRAQTYPERELLVINSSPEEQTRDVVARYPEVVFEQSQARLLPHAARNRGVERARGEILVFTDPDCRHRPDWLAQLVATVDAGHAIVGGSVELRGGQWLDQVIHLTKFFLQHPGLAAGPQSLLPTASVAITREAWAAVGPFDGSFFCGDTLLSERAARVGLEPWFNPDARVEHVADQSLRPYLKQRRERGREFARARIARDAWSRGGAATLALLAPLRLISAIRRIVSPTFRAGRSAGWILTALPLITAIQLAWLVGESHAFLEHAVGGAERAA
jgi:GT2 family glycosyltransferase